jgi:hypothetical protein
VTQAFLIHHSVDVATSEEAASAIRAAWEATSQPAFHFRNGRVLFVSPPAAAAVLMERMRLKLPRRDQRAFQEVAFDDGDGKRGFLYIGECGPWTEYSFERSED